MSSTQKRRRQRQRAHALARARQRYGVRLSCGEYERLLAQIINGAAPELKRLPDGAAVHLVRHRHVTLAAVFRDCPQRITTFLQRP